METIRIRGARTHNLKNIDLDLPRDRLISGIWLWRKRRVLPMFRRGGPDRTRRLAGADGGLYPDAGIHRSLRKSHGRP